jgi:tetratricopeptide (TPR) repeat protein
MKKSYLLAPILLFSFTIGMAQSNPLDKKLDKANELIDKGKADDADKYLDKLLTEHPDFGKGWDLFAQLRYSEYQQAKQSDNLFNNMTIVTTQKGKDGKTDTLKNDSLSNQLATMMSNIKPSKRAFNKFLYTLRKATATTLDAGMCSAYLRILTVDPPVDTNVSQKALKYFNDAEAQFGKKNYQQAALLYKRAIDEQPDFYKANMYLGDSYYFQGFYSDAADIWKGDVAKFPTLLEPRKYLVDAYAKEGKYSDALDAAINAMTVYPDYSLEQKLDDAAYLNHQKLTIKWTPRAVLPNKIDDGKSDLNRYTPDKEDKVKAPWTFYQGALDKIKANCNTKGIITTPSSLTKSNYLEVYSWEEMLANSTDPMLDQARSMQKDGYLDCYVMVTCYHRDFYDQYLDFVSKNKEKVIEYYKKYIN